MINIECSAENQEQVVKAVEQALKGVDANITVMDEEITMLDVAQFVSYNVKQQRVYLGRLEGRTRELRGELKEIKDMLRPFYVLTEIMLRELDEEDVSKLSRGFLKSQKERIEREKVDEVSSGIGTFTTTEMSKMP